MPICNHCHKLFKKGHGKGSLKAHCAAVKAAASKKSSIKSSNTKKHTSQKPSMLKKHGLTSGQKAARTRKEAYDNASPEEKARIDEIRSLAAVKAGATRKGKKPPKVKTSKSTDRSAAPEKAENMGKSAIEITKWRIDQIESKPKWQIVEFMGKKGKEGRGIGDLLAIRKDYATKVKKEGLKPGDLFEINLIQVKGGKASLPTSDDIKRLMKLKRVYYANNIILFEFRESRLSCSVLRENLDSRKKIDHRNAWKRVSINEIFS